MSRLRDTRALLESVRQRSDAILVGFSGGKDSIATLDLCVDVFGRERVAAYFMYLVKGLRCIEGLVDYCKRRYRIEVYKVPHWQIGILYKHAIYRPHVNKFATLRQTKFVDVERYVRHISGIEWEAMGHRMMDSLERRAMLHKLGGIDEKAHRVYPIWQWSHRDVYAYLRAKRIPLPPKLEDKRGVSNGLELTPNGLRYLKENWPEDYVKLLRVFPYAEAVVKRTEFFFSEEEKS